MREDLPIGPPYASLREVIEGLTRLEDFFLATRDRRGVFVTAYRLITETLAEWIEQDRFYDGVWVAHYAVSFANFYRDALEAYAKGEFDAVPGSWRTALETSQAGLALVIQDLMLGINAHINRDLPHALVDVGVDDDPQRRYEDHCRVNEALREAATFVQDRIAEYYAAGLGVLDRLLGNLDEDLTQFNFEIAREHAWSSAVALEAAHPEPQRERVVAVIERQAKAMARTILAPNVRFPWLIDVLRYVEQRRPWWEPLAHCRKNADSAPIPAPAAAAESSTASDLDEVIRRLGELIERWDRDRNRLSIYATVYRRITEKVKALVESGGFLDPDWMVSLDVRFANHYFDVIAKYKQGRLDEIPRGWAFALETVRTGRTIIVQDVAVQIAPRVIFDLPITLVEVGMHDNLDARRHDYEKTYELFIEELDCIQKVIAQKYSRLVTFMDILAGRLDETISNVLYTRARTQAWDDALALRDSSEDERQRRLRELDRRTIQSVNRVLFHNLPPMSWMVRIVRRLEEAFSGDWSDTIRECDHPLGARTREVDAATLRDA